jgi:hypothetical protein
VWYQITNCEDSSIEYSEEYPFGTFAINDRVTSPGNTWVVTGSVTTNPGGTLYAIVATGFVGCPGSTTTTTTTQTPTTTTTSSSTTTTTTLSPTTTTTTTGVATYYQIQRCTEVAASGWSIAYPAGSFANNERVTTLDGFTWVVTSSITFNPGGTLETITTTGFTGCPEVTTTTTTTVPPTTTTTTSSTSTSTTTTTTTSPPAPDCNLPGGTAVEECPS